jgi:hypothetical protein
MTNKKNNDKCKNKGNSKNNGKDRSRSLRDDKQEEQQQEQTTTTKADAIELAGTAAARQFFREKRF